MEVAMKTDARGIAALQGEEGFVAKPYNDIAQNATIAYGHLLHKGAVNQADWKLYGNGCSMTQAIAWLQHDIAWAEAEVNKVVTVQLNQNQFDAMVSFTYNEGDGTLEKSSVLRELNSENFSAAMQVMLEYDYAGGKPSAGLLNRRENEIALFNTPV
jgi:lysozyme